MLEKKKEDNDPLRFETLEWLSLSSDQTLQARFPFHSSSFSQIYLYFHHY